MGQFIEPVAKKLTFIPTEIPPDHADKVKEWKNIIPGPIKSMLNCFKLPQ